MRSGRVERLAGTHYPARATKEGVRVGVLLDHPDNAYDVEARVGNRRILQHPEMNFEPLATGRVRRGGRHLRACRNPPVVAGRLHQRPRSPADLDAALPAAVHRRATGLLRRPRDPLVDQGALTLRGPPPSWWVVTFQRTALADLGPGAISLSDQTDEMVSRLTLCTG
jgi:hypothetical protein